MRPLPLILAGLVLASPARAADTWSDPFPGVRRLHRTVSSPTWHINVLAVDLCAAGVSLRATRTDERQRTTSSFGTLVGAEAAINGDFFSYTDYSTVGLSIGDGAAWPGLADNAYEGNLVFGRDRVELIAPAEVVPVAAWMREMVSGRPQLVRDGVVLSGFTEPSHCTERHPRTAVGLSADRRTLLLAVVDGRSSSSVGMTCAELAVLMDELGAADALNLDGGGSSTMWLSGTGVVNEPSDGSQRVVANHLAVHATGSGVPGSCVEGRVVALEATGHLDPDGTSDLNGDGRADVCARGASGVRCYLSDGAGFPTSISGPALSDADGWRDPSRYSTLRLGDIDGDGRADLCARDADGVGCWPSVGDGFGPVVAGPSDLSDAGGWTSLEYYSTITLADVDGDGRDDLCARAATGFGCYLSTGTGFGPRLAGPTLSDASGWAHLSNYGTLRMGDVDGDGRADVCARADAGVYCWLSDGAGFPTRIDGPAWTDANGWGWPRYWSTIRLVDMDGDARADLCARTASDFRCHLSTGSGFGPALVGPALSDADGWGDLDNYSTIRLGDIDGDGRRDLCLRANAGVRCHRFDGVAFGPALVGPELSDASGWAGPDHYRTIRLADVNADGRADLCARAGAGLWCWFSSGTAFPTWSSAGPAWSDSSGWSAEPYWMSIRLGPPRCTPRVEECNGRDDDCDREVDEGCGVDAGPGEPDADVLIPDAAPGAGDAATAPDAAPLDGGGGDGDGDASGGCGCASGRGGTSGWWSLALLALALRRRRR